MSSSVAGAAGVEPGTELDSLRASMRAAAEAERAGIAAAAEARARELEASADAEIAALEARAERELAARLAIDAERIRGAELGARRVQRLAALREALEEVRVRARERLAELARGPRAPDALVQLVREALAAAGTPGEVAVGAPEAVRALLAERFPGLTVVASQRGQGSVVVTSADSRRVVDNGLDTRLDALFSLDLPRIAALVLGEEGA